MGSSIGFKSRLWEIALLPCCQTSGLTNAPGIPILDPHYWQDEEECTLDSLRHVFRSCTDEEIPLLEARLTCLREAGQVLYEVSQARP